MRFQRITRLRIAKCRKAAASRSQENLLTIQTNESFALQSRVLLNDDDGKAGTERSAQRVVPGTTLRFRGTGCPPARDRRTYLNSQQSQSTRWVACTNQRWRENRKWNSTVMVFEDIC